MVARDGERGYVRRDLDTEARAGRRRARARCRSRRPKRAHRAASGSTIPRRRSPWSRRCRSLPPGVVAEWVDGARGVVPSGGAEQLRVQIDASAIGSGSPASSRSKQGRIELAVLLDAARRQQRFVRLDEHRWVELDGALRRGSPSSPITRSRRPPARSSCRSRRVPAIRALADDGAEIDRGTGVAAARRASSRRRMRLRAEAARHAARDAATVSARRSRVASRGSPRGAPARASPTTWGSARPCKRSRLLVDRAKLGPAIVLAPTSVELQLGRRAARGSRPTLRPVVYGEASDRVATLAALGKHDMLIASYGLLDARRRRARRDHVRDARRRRGAGAEESAHRARAGGTRDSTPSFASRCRGRRSRIISASCGRCSRSCFPACSAAGSSSARGSPVRSSAGPATPKRAPRRPLIRPFLLRRTKAEVAPELPPRTEIDSAGRVVEAEERELYEDARLAAVAQLDQRASKGSRDEQRRFQVLAALTRLRLLASHPKLYDASRA